MAFCRRFGQHVREASVMPGDRGVRGCMGRGPGRQRLRCCGSCTAISDLAARPAQPSAPSRAGPCRLRSRSPNSSSGKTSSRHRHRRRRAPPRPRRDRASTAPRMTLARKSAGTSRAHPAGRVRRSAATCCVIWSLSAPSVRAACTALLCAMRMGGSVRHAARASRGWYKRAPRL